LREQSSDPRVERVFRTHNEMRWSGLVTAPGSPVTAGHLDDNDTLDLVVGAVKTIKGYDTQLLTVWRGSGSGSFEQEHPLELARWSAGASDPVPDATVLDSIVRDDGGLDRHFPVLALPNFPDALDDLAVPVLYSEGTRSVVRMLNNKGNLVFTVGFDASTAMGDELSLENGDAVTHLLSVKIDGDDSRDLLVVVQPPPPEAPYLHALFAVVPTQSAVVHPHSTAYYHMCSTHVSVLIQSQMDGLIFTDSPNCHFITPSLQLPTPSLRYNTAPNAYLVNPHIYSQCTRAVW
jgi:hypothetical protein